MRACGVIRPGFAAATRVAVAAAIVMVSSVAIAALTFTSLPGKAQAMPLPMPAPSMVPFPNLPSSLPFPVRPTESTSPAQSTPPTAPSGSKAGSWPDNCGTNEACLSRIATALEAHPVSRTPGWLTPLVLLGSMTVAWITLYFGLLASRATTFSNLRLAFSALRKELPQQPWSISSMPSSLEFDAMVKYWQYAFDEWFITQRLNPRIFGTLWTSYYREVIGTSCRSPIMVLALFKAAAEASGEPDRSFVRLILSPEFTDADVLSDAKLLARSHGIPIPPQAMSRPLPRVGSSPRRITRPARCPGARARTRRLA